MAVRQRTYSRRASQDLEELRSRHENLLSSMFSVSHTSRQLQTDRRFEGESSWDSSMDTTAARIDAAIKAAMAEDANRGAETFNHHLTPESSLRAPGEEGGMLYLPPPPRQRIDYPEPPRSSGSVREGGSGPTYKSYDPSPPQEYANRAIAQMDEAAANRAGGRRSSGGGGGYGYVDDSSSVFPVATDPYANGDRRRGGDSDGSSGRGDARGNRAAKQQPRQQQQQQPTKPAWERWGETATPRPVWQPDPEPGPAQAPFTDGRGDVLSSEGSSGPVRRGGEWQEQQQQSRSFHEQANLGSSGAIGPDERTPDMPPVQTDDTGGHPLQNGGVKVGGEGVASTPGGYDDPLELPGGHHHISLAKFLEVMTGPGLRVRKHHRAGKGSSGLRVLKYSEEGDSLTWDSHKILGAAQHVLPMSDVESVSMQPGKRVVLMCVGGKDSYAVFEAANDDAAAVLFVGLERLRELTHSRRDSV